MAAGSLRDEGTRVIPLERSHVADAAVALARAFAADAAFSSLWPEPGTRARALRRLLAVPLADAVDHGYGELLFVDRAVTGAAAWFPPGEYPMRLGRQLRALPQMLAVAAAAPRAFRRLSRFGLNVDAACSRLAAQPWAPRKGYGCIRTVHHRRVPPPCSID